MVFAVVSNSDLAMVFAVGFPPPPFGPGWILLPD